MPVYRPHSTTTARLTFAPQTMAARIRSFQAAVPGAAVYFPVKCCPEPVALQTALYYGTGLEYASIGEIEFAESLGIAPAPGILGSGPHSAADVQRAYALGVRTFVLDSAAQAQNLASLPDDARALMRLAVSTEDAAMPLSGRFGTRLDLVPKLLAECERMGVGLQGIMFHCGSQTTSLAAWESSLDEAIDALQLLHDSGHDAAILDIGGGFPAEFGPQPALSITDIGSIIRQRIGEIADGTDLEILAEPGRFVAAPAGTLHATVLDVERLAEPHRVTLDVGVFNGLHEVLDGLTFDLSTTRRSSRMAPTKFVGPSCDSTDVITTAHFAEDLSVGDEVVVTPAGAYTWSYASTFCGHRRPDVAIAASQAAERPENGVVRANADSPLFADGLALEFEVFQDSGFLDDDGTMTSYEPYAPSSVFNLAYVDGRAIGALREIWHAAAGFKVFNEMESWPNTNLLLNSIGRDRLYEFGTVAVVREGRGTWITPELYASSFRVAVAHGMTHWSAALDADVLAMMRDHFGFCFEDVGPTIDYAGSPTTPIVGELESVQRSIRATNNDLFERICQARDLTATPDYTLPVCYQVEPVIDLTDRPVPDQSSTKRIGTERMSTQQPSPDQTAPRRM